MKRTLFATFFLLTAALLQAQIVPPSSPPCGNGSTPGYGTLCSISDPADATTGTTVVTTGRMYSTIGQSAATTGSSGAAAGQSGATTGSSGAAAGQSGTAAGQSGTVAGQPGSTSGSGSSTTAPAYVNNNLSQTTDGNMTGAKGTKSGPTDAASATPDSAEATTSSDFELFTYTALGRSLPVFGSNLFANSSNRFVASDSVPVPSDYVVGPGDEILIRAWGNINIDTHVTVDRNGQIFIPRVGTLTVAGLHMNQLTGFINTAISQQFTGFQLTVNLGRLRSIQIFVLGQARRPGVYTISSLSTLVNALFESGGPSSRGTLRNIEVKRDGKIITHFDVYRLLLAGDKSADVHLLPGDIIYIPELGSQVALDGNVGTPAIYELKGNETIGSLISEAGGLTVIANTGRAVLERIIDHSAREVDEFALDAEGLDHILHDGDILRIFPISPKIQNAVTIRGNVASPGLYAWNPGMRISTLIPNRAFLLTSAYYNGQNALSLGGTRTPQIGGHATEINWNYAVIERLNKANLTTKLIPFALGEAIDHPESPENKELEPGDVVVVYSQNDIALPEELQAKYVRIDGQVNAPGTYRIADGETLRDLVRQAGGLAPHAYLYASELTRESIREEQTAELHRLAAQESQEMLAPSNAGVSEILGASANGSGDLDLRRAYIAQLNDIHPSGRVVLRLRPEDNSIGVVPDFSLEDGDHFYIPSKPDTVEILGSVYNAGAMRYSMNERFGEYVDNAGGPTRAADKKREYIIRADGSILSRQEFSNLKRAKIYPGDTLVVPPKLKTPSPLNIIGAATAIGSLALGAAAIKELQ